MKSVDELTNEEITNYLTGKNNKRSYTVTGLQQEAARRFVRYVEHNDLPQYDTGSTLPGTNNN